MVEEFKLVIFIGFVVCISIPSSHCESSTCLMVYKEGGAPAVFQSPNCPRWSLSTEAFGRRRESCQIAILQGRRKHQEDRILCELDLRIPFLGRRGINEVNVGVLGVFDGHNGAEASEMASKLLLEYFFLHVYFLLDGIYSVVLEKSTGMLLYQGDPDSIFKVLKRVKAQHEHRLDLGRSKWVLPEIFDESFHLEILKESLLRAIHDIDATFTKEAFVNNLDSGSTATVVLVVDGKILVANVGDSKALLCTDNIQSPEEVKVAETLLKLRRQRRRNGAISQLKDFESFKVATLSHGFKQFSVKELTRDHHPDRDDERSRVEAAGGYVAEWGGVPRVNGELAVSRAIGDLPFKSYGVISAPEVTDWQPLTANDSYLVAATDGIFEKMTTKDVCDLLWDVHTETIEKSELYSSCIYSLAECIVNIASDKGTIDNMAAVVLPLQSTAFLGTMLNDRCEGGDIPSSSSAPHKLSYTKLSIFPSSSSESDKSRTSKANHITSGLVPTVYASHVMENFNRLLVEGTKEKFGFFYLYENLDENLDYQVRILKNDSGPKLYDLPQALPESLGRSRGGPLSFYFNQNFWMHLGIDFEEDKGQCLNPEGLDSEGEKGQCINPESFARFLGLLESIPFPDTASNSSESCGYDTPTSRYVLKRRFGHGSYGEVWLAVHWNRSQVGEFNWNRSIKNCSINDSHMYSHDHNVNSQANVSSHHCHTGGENDNFFILKRIMVERGNNVYLSGLREKYFGEVFLNTSATLGGLVAEEFSHSFSKKIHDHSDLLGTNQSGSSRKGYTKTSEKEEGLKHIARYIESFESRSKEIWLVFRNEGTSLSKLIYTTEATERNTGEEKGENIRTVQILHPSTWWHWLRTTKAGKEAMRDLMWQLLMALKSCHDRNITHRDVKPENMVICFEEVSTGRCLKQNQLGGKQYDIKMRVIDFGSAIDEFSIKHLYGPYGPSRSEQTYEYTPPEALLNTRWFKGPKGIPTKYDIWSVGVVMLELILGSPHVFQLSARTSALLDQHLDGWNEATKELAYKLRSLMEMCILIPGSSSRRHQNGDTRKHNGFWPASWKCSEESFSHLVQSRDPLKQGFPNIWALRLVRQLLLWDPEDRPSIDEALRHPYFLRPPQA